MGNTIKKSTCSWFQREQSLALPLYLNTNSKQNKSLVAQLAERAPAPGKKPWLARAFDFCRSVFASKNKSSETAPKALVPPPATTTTPADDQDQTRALELPLDPMDESEPSEEHFFDEFYEVFETESARLRPCSSLGRTMIEDGDDDDDDDGFRYDCHENLLAAKSKDCAPSDCDETASCTTDLMDGFSDDEPSDFEDLNLSLVSDVDSKDEFFENQEKEADQLIRMASSCAMVSVQLKHYLCLCGACPSLKRIVKQVHQSRVWTDACEEKSLIRILLAFSVYNEEQKFDDEMIQSAKECLELWAGDEERAFQSFVILYDEVDYLVKMTPCCDDQDVC